MLAASAAAAEGDRLLGMLVLRAAAVADERGDRLLEVLVLRAAAAAATASGRRPRRRRCGGGPPTRGWHRPPRGAGPANRTRGWRRRRRGEVAVRRVRCRCRRRRRRGGQAVRRARAQTCGGLIRLRLAVAVARRNGGRLLLLLRDPARTTLPPLLETSDEFSFSELICLLVAALVGPLDLVSRRQLIRLDELEELLAKELVLLLRLAAARVVVGQPTRWIQA